MKFKIILTLFLCSAIFVVVKYYSYVFSRKVVGEIVGIDRVIEPSTIIGATGKIPAAQIFSFAVAIKDASGDILTASSEDRQWAVVEKGKCAEAVFFPYAPWILDKAGTYFGARLYRLYECHAPAH